MECTEQYPAARTRGIPALPVISDANDFHFLSHKMALWRQNMVCFEFIHRTFNVSTQYQIDLWVLF